MEFDRIMEYINKEQFDFDGFIQNPETDIHSPMLLNALLNPATFYFLARLGGQSYGLQKLRKVLSESNIRDLRSEKSRGFEITSWTADFHESQYSMAAWNQHDQDDRLPDRLCLSFFPVEYDFHSTGKYQNVISWMTKSELQKSFEDAIANQDYVIDGFIPCNSSKTHYKYLRPKISRKTISFVSRFEDNELLAELIRQSAGSPREYRMKGNRCISVIHENLMIHAIYIYVNRNPKWVIGMFPFREKEDHFCYRRSQ